MRSVRPACSWEFSLPTDPHSHKKPSDSPGGSFFIAELSLSAGSSRNYRCSDFSISCSRSLFHHFPRVFPFFDPFRQKRSLSGMDSDLFIFISAPDHFPGHLCSAPQCVVGRCNHITQLGQFPVSASFRAVSANLAMAALSVSLLYTKDTISPGGGCAQPPVDFLQNLGCIASSVNCTNRDAQHISAQTVAAAASITGSYRLPVNKFQMV